MCNNGPQAATSTSTAIAFTGAARVIGPVTASQGTCTTSGATVTCALGTLANGASATVDIVLEPQATGTLTATTTTTATQTDPVAGNTNDTENTTVNNGQGCTITGSAAANVINGTNGNDIICASGGSDVVNGNDTVYGGSGNDVINGNDTIDGGPGTDVAGGGAGNDTCTNAETTSSC
ncbi:calcium-binding protein [Streptomyces sp. NPDC021093]|uniref:calcium-binding protein n=1 Tax=Streptomyces sp. NPDC021093 TaxID=3365112 RepID=UPI0037ABF2CE